MKCFNCGNETKDYLCDKCSLSEDVLDKIYNEILEYKDGNIENDNIKEYYLTLQKPLDLWNCIPEILNKYDETITEYYLCVYYRLTRNSLFENKALSYLEKREIMDRKKQYVIFCLLKYYLRNDFIKPKSWCDLIDDYGDNLYIELYQLSSEFYSMIGEYDLAQKMLEKGRENNTHTNAKYFHNNSETMKNAFDKLEKLLDRYKNITPYWPQTEERRILLAEIYDSKGIKHPRIELKPRKVKENEFKPIKEKYELSNDFICFWCSETYNEPTVKCIYQIGAIKVKGGKIISEYQSLVRPWDGLVAKKRAAKELNVPLETISNAREVEFVIKDFFDFVENYDMVSTKAMSSQAKLLARAYRYSRI